MAEPAKKIPVSGQDPGNIVNFDKYFQEKKSQRNLRQKQTAARKEPAGLAGGKVQPKNQAEKPEEDQWDKATQKREERQKANTVDPANLKNKDFSKLKGAPASDANKLSKSIEPGAGAGPSRLSEDEKREQFKKSSPATQQFLKDKGWAPKGQPELGQPAALPGGTSQSNGKTGQERKNEKQLKKERDRSKKEEGKKEDRKKNKGSEEPKQGKQVDAIGHIFFFGLLCFAIFIDALALFTGGASSVLDWIFDIGFAVAVAVVLFITTGDVIGSLVGKKGLVNATQTIVEFIPVIDVLPFHVLAVVILYLDLQYNILNKVTKLKGLKST